MSALVLYLSVGEFLFLVLTFSIPEIIRRDWRRSRAVAIVAMLFIVFFWPASLARTWSRWTRP